MSAPETLLAAVPEPDTLRPTEMASSESPIAPPGVSPETPLEALPTGPPAGAAINASPSAGTPSLREMAETEQREDLAVNVAAAVTAARAAVQAPEERPALPVVPPDPAPLPATADTAVSESRKIKERMMRASRARRKERPDLVTASTDPVLPDWYEPDLDEPDEATRSAGGSGDR